MVLNVSVWKNCARSSRRYYVPPANTPTMPLFTSSTKAIPYNREFHNTQFEVLILKRCQLSNLLNYTHNSRSWTRSAKPWTLNSSSPWSHQSIPKAPGNVGNTRGLIIGQVVCRPHACFEKTLWSCCSARLHSINVADLRKCSDKIAQTTPNA